MTILYILILVISLLGAMYYSLYRKVAFHLPDTFPTEANRNKINHSKKVVVCFGDSNTHGNVSYNWVNDLSSQNTDYQFINAGRNSDLTYTLLQRIDDVIACKPDFITILIGTNDVNSTMGEAMEKRYQQLKRIDNQTHPDFEGFKKNYLGIIRILKEKTSAKIALMSLPVMGENLSHEANLKADKYSEFIEQLAENESLTYLQVREKQKEFLLKNPSNSKHVFEETYKLLNVSVIMNQLFGWSWDRVTKFHGFQLTPDNLHQNSVSGGMIRDLVKEFLFLAKRE